MILNCWMNYQIGMIGLPKNNDLLNELTGRYFRYTPDERRKVESKEEYKKRSGKRSPDLADALILCYAQRNALYSDKVRAEMASIRG